MDNKSEPTTVEVRKPKTSKGLTGWKKVSTATKLLAHQNATKETKAELRASMAGVAAAKTIAKNVRPATAGAKPSDGTIQATRKPIKPKMDLAKALSMMGFGTSRTMDASGSHNARGELNAALTRKMGEFEQKRRKLLEKDGKNAKYVMATTRNQTADKLRDDIRTLHEAYQFLARKYIRDEEKLKEKLNGVVTAEDLEDDLHLLNNFCEEKDENGDNDVFSKKPNNYMDALRVKADRKKTM